jgi:hypothetical protein
MEFALTAKSLLENRSPLPQENIKIDFIYDNNYTQDFNPNTNPS